MLVRIACVLAAMALLGACSSEDEPPPAQPPRRLPGPGRPGRADRLADCRANGSSDAGPDGERGAGCSVDGSRRRRGCLGRTAA